MERVERWIEFAVVGRPHGVRGAMYVRPLNSNSALLEEITVFIPSRAKAPVGGEAPLKVRHARPTPKGWLVSFEGVSDRDAAAALTNYKLFVQRTDLPDLSEDEVYLADLVGCTAVDPTQHALGVVEGFFDNRAHEVCVLRTAAGAEALVPFIDEMIADIDLEARVIVFDLPDGIPGLNE